MLRLNQSGVSCCRDVDIDYGIIPCPKYVDTQDTYYCRTDGALILTYPITLAQYEPTGR